jgi:hypothetical protein
VRKCGSEGQRLKKPQGKKIPLSSPFAKGGKRGIWIDEIDGTDQIDGID